ncbi:MAG: sensor histidine kinase [Anaerolineales bacterium]|jgi:signal transduction histidine kinase
MQWDIVIIFFIYGLAFFTMGIALTLERSRAPRLAERRVLRPLAIFGLLHGMHEWIEILLLQGLWLGVPFPDYISNIRYTMLIISFIPLIYFGLLMLFDTQQANSLPLVILIAMLGFYALVVLVVHQFRPDLQLAPVDTLARYLLAVPGAILAGLGLRKRAGELRAAGRAEIARRFRWAALGFGLYGLTQLFVSPIDLFPAAVINSAAFLNLLGFPVQLVRATVALLVTVNLIQAIQVVDNEREEQLMSAQQGRLEALEQVRNDLEEREALRRELLRHTVIAQEDERGRIARELHDETAQFLTALSLNLATLKNLVPRDPKTRDLIDGLQSQIRLMTQGIYRLVHDLRPAQLDDLGLVPALQYLAEEEKKRAGLQVNLNFTGERQRLDPLVETVLFRVAQEALINVIRHAQCEQANMALAFEPEQVVLKISDQGVGIDKMLAESPERGWGLAGMRERVDSVEGELHISSPASGGTLVEVCVPILETKITAQEETIDESHPPDVS